MRGQSVGVFPIANGNPEPIVAELEKIMDTGESGLGQNVVKFQTVSRMNAIMVITRKPALLHTAETWIKRLDRANTSKNSVHVYRIKYGEARQIARVLTDMFIGSSAATTRSIRRRTSWRPVRARRRARASTGCRQRGSSSQQGGFGSQQQATNGLVANRGFGGAPPPTPVSTRRDPQRPASAGKPIHGRRAGSRPMPSTTRC